VPSHAKSNSVRRAFPLGRKQLLIAGAAVLVIAGVIVGIVATGGPKHTSANGGTTSSSSSTVTTQALASNRCPLTDLPAPGGTPPSRPPAAVKIGNEPGPDAGGLGAARPQSGLNEADVVYDTPAEGGIMRYVALFQCNDASLIGPVRSVRWVDWHILAEFRVSILAHVGGINQDRAVVTSKKYILNADDFSYSQAYEQIASRVSPDSTYTSTSALYKLFHNETPPRPIFKYTATLPAGAKPTASVGINFSYGTDVLWKWDPTTKSWLHFYGSGSTPDIDTLDNKQVSTTNIVIQIVNYRLGPYAESPGGSGDVESITTGSGPGYVLRDGEMIPVTWHRSTLQDATTYTTANGATVGLAPGRTWVEMVLNTTAKVKGALTFTS